MSPILIIHIAGGIVAILSGTVTILSRKGARRHRVFGSIFVIAMLIMASTATYMAIQLGQTGNIFAGPLVLYLVSTAWITMKRKENTIGMFEYAAFVVAPLAFLIFWLIRVHIGNRFKTSSAGPRLVAAE